MGPVSTFVTPDQWRPIGTSAATTVPADDSLVVLPVITWPASEVPPTGRDAFVVTLHAERDPAPLSPRLLPWRRFEDYLRRGNSVASRNHHLVAVPQSPSEVALDLSLGGAPDRVRAFDLEFAAWLPKNSSLQLEVDAAKWCAVASRVAIPRVSPVTTLLPLHFRGSTVFPSLTLPAAGQIPARILVKVPSAASLSKARVSVRQRFNGVEVGRVTWQLTRSAP